MLASCTRAAPQLSPTSSAPSPSGRTTTADSVGHVTEGFVDRTRDDRQLDTTIWYPEADGEVTPGRHPVVVFSHGLGGTPESYTELFEDWVRAGFVVVGPTYPLTNEAVSTQPRDLVNQPADVSFVLDRLEDLETDEDHALNGALDLERVAAVGHSLGGMTTVGLMSRCCDEDRLDAAVVYAGSALGFERHGLVDDPPPVLFIHGDEDGTVTIDDGRSVYDDVEGPRGFVTLLGGGHSTPFAAGSDPYFDVVAQSTLAFLEWTLLDDGGALDTLRAQATNGGLADLEDDLERR